MGAKITIIDNNATSRDHLKAALEREGFKDVGISGDEKTPGAKLWVGDKQQAPPKNMAEADCFVRPVRLGAILDRVRRYTGASSHAKPLSIGAFKLDVLTGELSKAGDIVRLTDKEKQILVLLHEADGEKVEREVLLEKVWGYAQGLETHTLETHIYRLRQKIEKNPAKPDILLTDGSGYKIS